MSNYTGPVLLAPFIGPRDSFMLTLHSNNEDPESIAKIVARYAEDGYRINLAHRWADGQKGVGKFWMVNGSLVDREPGWAPSGFPKRSAFLRA